MTQTRPGNYYETLKVSPEATIEAIRSAFDNLKKVYGEKSSAVYSIYSEEERRGLMERITAAYQTLMDPEKRRMYDAALASGTETFGEIGLSCMNGKGPGEAPEVAELREEIRYDIRLREPLAVMDTGSPAICEEYRALYVKLEQINRANGRKSVLSITSAREGEGKTTTAVNLAYVIASGFGKKVLLIEGDLKKPGMADLFEVEGKAVGLVDILEGKEEFNSCLCRLKDTNLYVVLAGQAASNSSELLAMPLLNELLLELRKRFDYILIDSPPVLPFADMTVLSGLVDGLVFVVRAGKTSRNLVRTAVKEMGGANIIGMVLNGADAAPGSYSY